MNSPNENEDLSGRGVAAAPTNMVYGSRDPNLNAQCIYFYYLMESASPEYYMRAYVIEKPTVITNIENEIIPILRDIRSNTLKPSGWALGDIRWRRKSYIVVALDHPSHKLNANNAVEFTPYGSFSGGSDYDVSKTYEDITCFYCENHMTDGKGGALTDYRPFPFYVEAKHSHPHGGPPAKILSHSDTGTNMGPPVPPP